MNVIFSRQSRRPFYLVFVNEFFPFVFFVTIAGHNQEVSALQRPCSLHWRLVVEITDWFISHKFLQSCYRLIKKIESKQPPAYTRNSRFQIDTDLLFF